MPDRTGPELVEQVLARDGDSLSQRDRQLLDAYLGTFDLPLMEARLLARHPDYRNDDGRMLSDFKIMQAATEIRHIDHVRWQRTLTTRVVEEPVELYRSVSPGELADILEKGCVLGRLNTWNRGDRRRLVLFADSPRDIARQGECVHRQIMVALAEHPAALALDRAYDDVDAAVTAEERQHALRTKNVAWGALDVVVDPLRKAAESRRCDEPWTSALIRTCPLAGATVWPRGHLHNMMNCDEYGMPSGSVLIEDIVEVTLLKERRVVARGVPDDFRGIKFPSAAVLPDDLYRLRQSGFAM